MDLFDINYLKNKNFINELVKILDEDKITSIL